MKKLVALCAFVFGTFLFGNEVGNGGHVVVCTGNTIEYKLLDYYEAERQGLNIYLGPPTEQVETRVLYALKQLESIDTDRTQRYTDKLNEFFHSTRFLNSIPKTKDYGKVDLEPHCHLEQIAAQYKPQFPGDTRYIINKDLWNKLDQKTQAGVILHEIIYEEAIQRRHRTSELARQFAALISSDGIRTITPAEYTLRMEREFKLGIDHRRYRLTDHVGRFHEDNGFLFGAKINVNERTTEFKKVNIKTGETEVLFTRPNMRRVFLAAADRGYLVWSETELVNSSTGTSYKETYLYVRNPGGKLTRIRQLKDWTIHIKAKFVGGDLFYGFFSRENSSYQLYRVPCHQLENSQKIFQERSVIDYDVDERFVYLIRRAENSYNLERFALLSGPIKILSKVIKSQEWPSVLVHKGDIYVAESERGAGKQARLLRLKEGSSTLETLYTNRRVRNPHIQDNYVYIRSLDGVVRLNLATNKTETVPVHFRSGLKVGPGYFFLGNGEKIRQYSFEWFTRLNHS